MKSPFEKFSQEYVMQSQTIRIVANAVDVGSISLQEYNRIKKVVTLDPFVAVKQALNYGQILLNAVLRSARAAPTVFFWAVLILAVLEPEVFAAAIAAPIGAVSMGVVLGMAAIAGAISLVVFEMVFLGKFPGHVNIYEGELNERIARYLQLGHGTIISIIKP